MLDLLEHPVSKQQTIKTDSWKSIVEYLWSKLNWTEYNNIRSHEVLLLRQSSNHSTRSNPSFSHSRLFVIRPYLFQEDKSGPVNRLVFCVGQSAIWITWTIFSYKYPSYALTAYDKLQSSILCLYVLLYLFYSISDQYCWCLTKINFVIFGNLNQI